MSLTGKRITRPNEIGYSVTFVSYDIVENSTVVSARDLTFS